MLYANDVVAAYYREVKAEQEAADAYKDRGLAAPGGFVPLHAACRNLAKLSRLPATPLRPQGLGLGGSSHPGGQRGVITTFFKDRLLAGLRRGPGTDHDGW